MAINREKLITHIKEMEGFRANPYKDTEGHLTIGYGWNLDAEPLPEGYKPPLSEEQGVALVRMKLDQKIEELSIVRNNDSDAEKRLVGLFNALDDARQSIIADCAYQMGTSKIWAFVKMWDALEKKDFNEAADEMLDSLAAQQTTNRWFDHAARMRNTVAPRPDMERMPPNRPSHQKAYADRIRQPGDPPLRRPQETSGTAAAQAEAARLDALGAEAAKEDASMNFKPDPSEGEAHVEGNVLGDEEYADGPVELHAQARYDRHRQYGITRTRKEWKELTQETRNRWIAAEHEA